MAHPLEHHTTLLSVASIVIDALESYGVDAGPIIEAAGFNTEKTYPLSSRVSTRKLSRLWDLAVEYSGDPCFGLTYAAYIQPSTLHGLGLSWIASHTLKDGLQRLVRFQRILSSDLRIDLRETRRSYVLYKKVSQKDDPFQFPDADYHSGLATIYRICQIMLGPEIKPLSVTFEHDAPDCMERFEQFFGIPVTFNGQETAIEFDKATCETPTSSANPDLTRINDQVVIDYLNQFDRNDIVTRTRMYIVDHLPSGIPKQSVIASDLNLSLRSFQRKLKQAGTSYAELLDHIRHEMACSYLESPQHQIITIAYLLGYSDPSNFTRAFKRWDGQSPQEFRENS